MASRRSNRELLAQLGTRLVHPGLWKHKSTGNIYRVKSLRALDERTTRVLVLYSPLQQPKIVWAREETEFINKFTKCYTAKQ